jgi:hypothetical protein
MREKSPKPWNQDLFAALGKILQERQTQNVGTIQSIEGIEN